MQAGKERKREHNAVALDSVILEKLDPGASERSSERRQAGMTGHRGQRLTLLSGFTR